VGGRGMLGALGGQVGECWLLWSGGIDLRWK
jgi:hypothetical protein